MFEISGGVQLIDATSFCSLHQAVLQVMHHEPLRLKTSDPKGIFLSDVHCIQKLSIQIISQTPKTFAKDALIDAIFQKPTDHQRVV